MTTSGLLSLGHRRLRIFDLSDRAAQPFSSVDSSVELIFNGAVYNFRELVNGLTQAGVALRTSSDTEIVCESLSLKGEEAANDWEGMFALIAYDKRRRKLILIRDRFGIKPLYFVNRPGLFAAGSEIKMLYDLPGLPKRADPERAFDFLTAGLTDHHRQTMFEGVQQLLPGERIVLDLCEWRPGDPVEPVTWYTPPLVTRDPGGRAAAAAEFKDLLDASITRHWISDQSVGACLSGGLDSGALVSRASRLGLGQGRIIAVSAVFPGDPEDEGEFARETAANAGVEQIEVRPTADELVDSFNDLIWRQDEPFGSPSIFVQRQVFKAAAENGLVVMNDGQGADELLAGYDTAFDFYHRALLLEGRYGAAARSMINRRRFDGCTLRGQLEAALRPVAGHWLARNAWRTRRRPIGPYTERLLSASPIFGSSFLQCLADTGEPLSPDVRSLRRIWTRRANLPMLLRYEDRNSMTFGIEARVPFLDRRLAEFCLSLPDDLLFGPRSERKSVLRNALGSDLPAGVLARRDKTGFAAPERRWFRGALKDWALEILHSVGRDCDWFEPASIDAMIARLRETDAGIDWGAWRIICWARWLQVFRITL